MDPNEAARPKARLLKLTCNGWSMHRPPHGDCTADWHESLMPDTWREPVNLGEMAPDIVGLNLRTIPEELICTWTVMGPVCDFDVPLGMVRVGGTQHVYLWKNEPSDNRDPRFGNLGPSAYVGLELYAELAVAFGAERFSRTA